MPADRLLLTFFLSFSDLGFRGSCLDRVLLTIFRKVTSIYRLVLFLFLRSPGKPIIWIQSSFDTFVVQMDASRSL